MHSFASFLCHGAKIGPCLSVPVSLSIQQYSVFSVSLFVVCAFHRALGADGCWPVSQTEVTFTLPQSNTDLNQLIRSVIRGGGSFPDTKEEREREFYSARIINPFDGRRWKLFVGNGVFQQNEKDNVRYPFTQPLKKQNVCHLSEAMILCKTELLKAVLSSFLFSFFGRPDGESNVGTSSWLSE